MEQESQQLIPGTVIDDRYTVIEPLKRGGMGAVYKVTDRRLAGLVCALKQMHEVHEFGAHAEVVERRFEEEMKVLTTLRHPGIPRVHNFFTVDSSRCIVMDFVEGPNLEQILSRGPVSTEFALDVADQVLHILQYLHGHTPAVIHRDIKPANLILTPDGTRVTLVDFGLARVLGSPQVTQTMAGTLGYAAVEQLQGRAEERSDLYSLGATLHHLLAGSLAPAFILPPLLSVAPGVPESVAEIVDRALKMQPDDRYPDASSMLAAVLSARANPSAPVPEVHESTLVRTGQEIILVVDDDLLVRNLVVRVLQREMYQVIAVDSGQLALETAVREKPDLIISDLAMPEMDGVALCRKLQSHRATRDIPVLLLTGRTEIEYETSALDAGAADFISKPIVPQRLVARVQAALRRRLNR